MQEPIADLEQRVKEATQEVCRRSHEGEDGRTVVVVAHSAVLSAIICHVLGLEEVEENLSLFRTDAGSVTVVRFIIKP